MSKSSIKLNHYIRKDGSHMLYANLIENRRKVASIGFSEDDQRKRKPNADEVRLAELMPSALDVAADVRDDLKWGRTAAPPDFDAHEEPKARLTIGDLYVTDVAMIGGFVTASDGVFLVTAEGKIIDAAQWINLDSEEEA